MVYNGSVYFVVLKGSVNNVNISSCCINVLPAETSVGSSKVLLAPKNAWEYCKFTLPFITPEFRLANADTAPTDKSQFNQGCTSGFGTTIKYPGWFKSPYCSQQTWKPIPGFCRMSSLTHYLLHNHMHFLVCVYLTSLQEIVFLFVVHY